MKLGHFLHIDPAYPGKGLDGCSKLDGVVFHEFVNDLPQLQRITAAIGLAANSPNCPRIDLNSLDSEHSAVEGHILMRLHLDRERDRNIVARKKAFVLQAHGHLACEVCGFDFSAFYGDLGCGFIEAHHRRPLHLLRPGDRTRLADLALVCANCHRMLHRGGIVIQVEALRAVLTAPSQITVAD